MQVKVHEIGQSRSRVVVIDDFLPEASRAVDVAAALAPFPPEGETAYPGRRRQISPGDAASAYVMFALKTVAPVLERAFDAANFQVMEASYSLVTTAPDALTAVQRVPHYDYVDQDALALVHHLHTIPDTGTCFYRHISSGLEKVDSLTAQTLRQAIQAENEKLGPAPPGFTSESTDRYEKILHVEGRFNRLLIYQGCLLHSGFISQNFAFSSDPRTGRLTGNIFVRRLARTEPTP